MGVSGSDWRCACVLLPVMGDMAFERSALSLAFALVGFV